MGCDIVIVGCGGHGREVLDIVRAVNRAAGDGAALTVLGFVDDRPSVPNLERVERLGTPYLGPTCWFERSRVQARCVVGIGDPRVRLAVARRLDGLVAAAPALVHPAATVGPDAVLGDGTVVFAGARITTNVQLGRHVHVNQNATVAHDCVLGDAVSVNPMAAVSGECWIGTGALIGASAVVLQGRRVGDSAVVGAGACVVRDVAAGVTVKGVPAR